MMDKRDASWCPPQVAVMLEQAGWVLRTGVTGCWWVDTTRDPEGKTCHTAWTAADRVLHEQAAKLLGLQRKLNEMVAELDNLKDLLDL